MTLAETRKPVMAFEPQTNGGALTGDYVKCSECDKLEIMVVIQQANAATCALTIEQATTAAGGSTKAITNTVPIWSNLDTAASDTLVRRTDAVSYTTDAGVKNKIVIFQVDPSALDLANGFYWITVKCALSHADNIVGAVYFFDHMRYQADPPPTQIA
jgi:hypothetical protein